MPAPSPPQADGARSATGWYQIVFGRLAAVTFGLLRKGNGLRDDDDQRQRRQRVRACRAESGFTLSNSPLRVTAAIVPAQYLRACSRGQLPVLRLQRASSSSRSSAGRGSRDRRIILENFRHDGDLVRYAEGSNITQRGETRHSAILNVPPPHEVRFSAARCGSLRLLHNQMVREWEAGLFLVAAQPQHQDVGPAVHFGHCPIAISRFGQTSAFRQSWVNR